ncbi:hypothetical protein NX059_012374 [Plenodomus lindquistii]|nr:hypothetical protein NX059_012374 [Plenodomus lindquistii]
MSTGDQIRREFEEALAKKRAENPFIPTQRRGRQSDIDATPTSAEPSVASTSALAQTGLNASQVESTGDQVRRAMEEAFAKKLAENPFIPTRRRGKRPAVNATPTSAEPSVASASALSQPRLNASQVDNDGTRPPSTVPFVPVPSTDVRSKSHQDSAAEDPVPAKPDNYNDSSDQNTSSRSPSTSCAPALESSKRLLDVEDSCSPRQKRPRSLSRPASTETQTSDSVPGTAGNLSGAAVKSTPQGQLVRTEAALQEKRATYEADGSAS